MDFTAKQVSNFLQRCSAYDEANYISRTDFRAFNVLTRPYDFRIISNQGGKYSYWAPNISKPYLAPSLPVMYHRHDFFELIYVMNGYLTQYIEQEYHRHEEGTLCLMDCNTQHGENYQSDFVCAYLLISKEYAQKNLQACVPQNSILRLIFDTADAAHRDRRKKYVCFSPVSPKSTRTLEGFWDTILAEFIMGLPGADHIACGTMQRMFFHLQDDKNYTRSYKGIELNAEEIILSQITHIMECSTGTVSRQYLSQQLSYSGDYLNRLTKKHYGMSLIRYNHEILLRKAEWFLSNTNMPIVEITGMLGYENRTYFYKAFYDKYHMTPLEYRRMHQSAPQRPDPSEDQF